MPAKSKSQQRLFGLARSIQKGETPASESPQAAKIAKSVSVSDVKDFAKTKRKGLRERLAKRSIS